MTTTEATPTLTTPAVEATATSVVASPPRTLSIIGFVLGLVSLVTGQVFFLPIAGIVLGVLGYRQEPAGRTFAIWALVLNGLALFGWMIIAALGLAFALPFLAFSDWAWAF